MVMGAFHVRTYGSMPFTRMGARNTVPSSMARMVPLGLFHIFLRSYSSMRAAFGVMVAHFTATPRRLVAFAESIVTWSSVALRFSSPRSKYSVLRSTNGTMRSSLIIFHMMRVISSPSISTRGVFIRILAIETSERASGRPGPAAAGANQR